ncbi:MAG TPA: methyltransferase domain-containing protein [Stackebrandtia sp.]|uniref:class I SAM-dependent methyltransferase n=1 Tax=Stackebrandtia sp. TaxID=2023065 RepID=UPI002D6D4AB8|nr:methyltransferase domain-containing protein [Stackebrandtia sp.]HZE38283.1 methyltransferase domain-containing protein [Stackebrandtia sp.]
MRDKRLARTFFNTDADAYDRSRSRYPDEVYTLLAEHGLTAGARVLEIGPGTGQATAELLSRGSCVTAVELGDALADKLENLLGGSRLRVLRGEFETVDIPADDFDLAVSATAFHWVDPTVGVPKLAALLRTGAVFAPWWMVFGDPERPTPFRRAMDRVIAEHLPERVRDPRLISHSLDRTARVAELENGARFEVIDVREIRWEHTYSAQQACLLHGTYSGMSEVTPEQRQAFLDALARCVREEFDNAATDAFVTAVYVARRL